MTDSGPENTDLSALKIDRSRKSGPPGHWKRWLKLLWLLLIPILYLTYHFALRQVTPSVKVKVTTAKLIGGSEASAEVVASGYVVAQIKAAVASKATGRLRVLNVEEGDSVTAGFVLAELENDDILVELDLARAYIKQARADSVQAALNYVRQQKLFDAGHSTEENFELATAQYQRALANVEAMAASVRAAQVAMENTIIRAPFDGTILTKNADIGEMVAPLASATSSRGAVVTMADMGSLEVEADVSESNIHKVRTGQPCEIVLDAYPRKKYDGHVKKIVPTADRTRATVLTRVAFDNIDDRVLPEMSARVNFMPFTDEQVKNTSAATIAINNDAITMRQGEKVVFKVVNGTAQQTSISPGRQLGDMTEVLSGLKVGDSVILSPAGGLVTGDKIEVVN